LLLSDFAEKLEWLCQLKFWDDAVQLAGNAKDIDALQTIRNNCKDPNVISNIDKILKTL